MGGMGFAVSLSNHAGRLSMGRAREVRGGTASISAHLPGITSENGVADGPLRGPKRPIRGPSQVICGPLQPIPANPLRAR